MDKVVELIQYSFPHMPKEVITGRRIGENFWNYSQQICREFSLKREEDYLFLKGNGWDFSQLVHERADQLVKHPSNIEASVIV